MRINKELLIDNLCLKTDSYKIGHWPQYPPGTRYVSSYFEHRSGGKFQEVMSFGLQYLLKRYLTKPVTSGHVAAADYFLQKHFGAQLFNVQGWYDIVKDHGGYLPLEINAVPEGMVIPESNILMNVVNTDPKYFWLTNYFESLLSHVWATNTIGTLSFECRKLCRRYLEMTANTVDKLPWMLNDFGYRGASSDESAAIGGMAHLVNFRGSDNLQAIADAYIYYDAEMAADGIPASEHSTITSWTQDGEVDAYRNMIKTYGHMPIYACVSDSYDVYRACKDYWGTQLKDDVLNAKGTLVVRPDSGTPHIVVLKCLKILGDKFGFSINRKGYKVLDAHVRMIQGDGVDYFEIRKILQEMYEDGWSAENIAFGMGGGLLQKVDRDTQRSAFKCSAIDINGNWIDVFKNPITDTGKISKRGRMGLYKKGNGYKTLEAGRPGDILRPVFRNGELLVDDNFDQVINRMMAHEDAIK